MSGLLKTVSNLGQNVSTCLPPIVDREAFAVLEKREGFLSRRVGEDSPGAWLPADTKGGPQALSPVWWGGSQREAFCSVKLLIFFY